MAIVTLYARVAEGSVTAADGLTYQIRHGLVSVPQACADGLESAGFIRAPISEQPGIVPTIEGDGVNVIITGHSGANVDLVVDASDGGQARLITGLQTLSLGPLGAVFTGLPTSDPLVLNALWNNSGTLKISAGPPP